MLSTNLNQVLICLSKQDEGKKCVCKNITASNTLA